MFFLYNVVVIFAGLLLKVVALISPKIRLFIDGRRDVFDRLQQSIKPGDKTFWFHAASLGEYEQGLPVMERMKKEFPNHKIVLTFFSPSGYEVRKNNNIADVTVYLPLDTKSNAKKFVDLVRPEMSFFIKYEFWPNYLNELKKQHSKVYLISGIFRKDQLFFKWYGGFYRKSLRMIDYFFVQNHASKELLATLNISNVTISGDTRFDRVAAILEKDNSLDFIEDFKNDTMTVVVGSSWPKDEAMLVDYINASDGVKFIIAPHNIKVDQIQQLKYSITKSAVLFSEKEGKNLADFDVFIIDTIGILTKIYSYSDIAYVGGGFGNPGVHNVLEPATFGVPIVIGPNYSHFAEATALVCNGGAISVTNNVELKETLDMLISNADIRAEKGHICSTFVQMNKNATDIIVKHLTAAASPATRSKT
ncbi:MAG TPA: glycosyltransferase N-terminal domain-containing protein [Flavobacterium sp.]|jgi:3-deoxy-D-manno-octulosonic-acid transferase